MYQLKEEQIASVETFISKLEDSMIKSKVEKWFAEITPTGRVTSEQMNEFVALSAHLPKPVQNFPQSFAMAVKNTPETDKKELNFKAKDKTNLTAIVDESIEDVKNVKVPKNKEETLHKLGVEKGSVGGKKVTDKKK